MISLLPSWTLTRGASVPNPAEKFWERLLPAYRARDWPRCLRELRPVLDADEDAIVPRMLSAAFHERAEQASLALLQYETLLPLAVGQGDFLRTFGVQKHLDALHPAAASHARRFEALFHWFASLRSGTAGARLPASAEEVTVEALLDLEPATFARFAEAGSLEMLDPDPRTLDGQQSSVRLVLFGRVHWSLTRGDDVLLLEGVAEAGDAIAVNPALGDDVRLTLHAEWPSEFLAFAPADVALLINGPSQELRETRTRVVAEVADIPAEFAPPLEEPIEEPAAPAIAEIVAAPAPVVAEVAPPPAPPAPPAPPSEPIVEVTPPRRRPAPRRSADDPPIERPLRPQPDPRFEPTLASGAPVARRRETRISVNVQSGIARLGLEDTRVSPIDGRLTNLTAEMVEVTFPRSELRHLRSRLEQKIVTMRLALDSRTSVACVGRIRWTTTLAAGVTSTAAGELALELEFMAMAPPDQERIQAAARAYQAARERRDEVRDRGSESEAA